jgi:hypothetical protein
MISGLGREKSPCVFFVFSAKPVAWEFSIFQPFPRRTPKRHGELWFMQTRMAAGVGAVMGAIPSPRPDFR